jgi:hypothetical protein
MGYRGTILKATRLMCLLAYVRLRQLNLPQLTHTAEAIKDALIRNTSREGPFQK